MEFPTFERYRTATGLARTKITPEEESSPYESGRAEIDSQLWRIRTARVTPTKAGAFVAVWRRSASGGTEPFSSSDESSGLLVLVEDGTRFGAFAFTSEHLVELGISRSSRAPGKRGFRVYPAWCAGLNAAATRTQHTQSRAFTDLSH